MGKLDGKVALITGGNSGIGLATARLFKENGARVVITARSTASFEKAKKELNHSFDLIQTDVSQLKDLDSLYDHIKNAYGGLDVLFANAGIALLKPTVEVDPENFDAQFNTNVRGLYFTVAKALPLLKKGSSVILNASLAARKGIQNGSVYAATKAAVRSFARSWTVEISAEKTRFNVLSPGPIETPIFGKLGMPAADIQGWSENMKKTASLHRFGRPEEMAAIALFLASSDSSYVCGADILADGGIAQA
jgi:NAD(P)-dependent dehydrogenase (short-subunit alcohol dehydrogenase family)